MDLLSLAQRQRLDDSESENEEGAASSSSEEGEGENYPCRELAFHLECQHSSLSGSTGAPHSTPTLALWQ